MRRLSARLLAAATVAALPVAALDLRGLDPATDPCRDFYRYANGPWVEATRIPDDRSVWSTFSIVAQRNEEVIERAFREALAAPRPAEASDRRKLLDFYASGMDTAAIERAGLEPVAPLLAAASSADSPAHLATALATLMRQGVDAGFGFRVGVDRRDSSRWQAQLSQGGLGLPEREYYFRDDAKSRELREAYARHVATMLALAGTAPEAATAMAARAIDLEAKLARASRPRADLRDPEKNDHPMSVADLERAAPAFPWRAWLDALGGARVETFNVGQPEFFAAFAKLAVEAPAADWQAYLRWHVLRALATKLPERFEREAFEFFDRRLAGTLAVAPRHRRVLTAIGGRYGNAGLGPLVGQLYVEKAFPPEAKARALDLVGHVRAALAQRIRTAEWMGEETRARSLEKLAAMAVKIGYPDRWREFGDYDLGERPFAANWIASREADLREQLSKLGRPVDRSEWRFIAPHIVNAAYSPSSNAITFPAGILQPPFFDPKADDAANFGAIGMVIGHEITHGFDDTGRRYDAQGNLREWWTAEDAKRYTERAERVVKLYEGFDPVDGVRNNGRLTLGENLSDIAGARIAYEGYKRAARSAPAKDAEGFTPDQRFFLAMAQAWRGKARPEFEVTLLRTDSHSLPRQRIKGVLLHMPEFAKSFSCGPDAILAESQRANLW